MHSLAVFSALITPVPLIFKTITIVLVLLSLSIHLKKKTGSKDFVLRYNSEFGWEIAHINNHFESIEILPSTVLTTYVVFLHYKQQSEKNYKQKFQSTVIFKDALDNDEFRKLRVELKISGLHNPE